jgi:hypothetical protein
MKIIVGLFPNERKVTITGHMYVLSGEWSEGRVP